MHSDTHDVFVFQTAGSKQWEVHTPDGVEQVLLEPGVSMYLPTGTPHAARAQDTVSLHVTLGINQLTWRGLVERSLAPVLRALPDTHLPPATSTTPRPGRRLDPARAARRRGARPGRGDAVEAEVRRFLTSRGPRLAGGLTTSSRSVTSRHAGCGGGRATRASCSTAANAWTCCSVTGRSTCRRVRPALDKSGTPRAAAGGPRPAPRPESRLVLCRRLVREGLLEVVA